MDFFQFIDTSSQQPTTTTTTEKTVGFQTDYQNVKKGQMVKIVRKENSNLNMYKGYLAEIRDYKKGNDYVMLVLLAVVYPKLMKFPIDHFIIQDLVN